MITIEGPTSKLHNARLLIKWEVCDVDGARALIDSWWNPQDFSIRIDQDVRLVAHFIVTVSIVKQYNIGLRIRKKV